jgi:hypothetical protein
MAATSNDLGLLAHELGFKAFAPPTSGFDPKTASDEVLRNFGVPRRPAADASPQYRRLWHRMFSRRVTYPVPRFKSRPRTRRIFGRIPRSGPHGIQYESWAGFGIASSTAPLVTVSGTWTVPNLSAPSSAGDGAWCINSAWIGIDGFSQPSNDILQAGVDLKVMRQRTHGTV